jgi:hypothetical protein
LGTRALTDLPCHHDFHLPVLSRPQPLAAAAPTCSPRHWPCPVAGRAGARCTRYIGPPAGVSRGTACLNAAAPSACTPRRWPFPSCWTRRRAMYSLHRPARVSPPRRRVLVRRGAAPCWPDWTRRRAVHSKYRPTGRRPPRRRVLVRRGAAIAGLAASVDEPTRTARCCRRRQYCPLLLSWSSPWAWTCWRQISCVQPCREPALFQ